MTKQFGRPRAIAILDSLRHDWNLSDKEILEYIIYNWMSGDQAEEAMVDACQEFDVIPFGVDQEDEDME